MHRAKAILIAWEEMGWHGTLGIRQVRDEELEVKERIT